MKTAFPIRPRPGGEDAMGLGTDVDMDAGEEETDMVHLYGQIIGLLLRIFPAAVAGKT